MDHVYSGVLFSESVPEGVREIFPVSIVIDSKWFSQTQLKTLNDVKDELAKKVKEKGCDALVRFEYGQRHVSFWKSFLSGDDVTWWGRGVAGRKI